MNVGIDYGCGRANIDEKTGIRYGVISMHSVCQSWCDDAEPIYSNGCPYCGNEPKSGKDIREMKRCPSCYKKLTDLDFEEFEPIAYKINDGEYIATQSFDDTDIFVIKSPYYTTCEYCSPCAPGAGFVMHTVENGVKAYCFGHDWFESETAPYPVYSVETDELIVSEKK